MQVVGDAHQQAKQILALLQQPRAAGDLEGHVEGAAREGEVAHVAAHDLVGCTHPTQGVACAPHHLAREIVARDVMSVAREGNEPVGRSTRGVEKSQRAIRRDTGWVGVRRDDPPHAEEQVVRGRAKRGVHLRKVVEIRWWSWRPLASGQDLVPLHVVHG